VEAPTGTVTFLFTDIEGSTRLWQAAPEAMRSSLARHDQLLAASIDAHSGYVFSTGGDGFAATFQRVGEAVAAAVEAQGALTAEDWPAGAEVRVRMGLHTGEAEERDGDYFGADVNRAARLMAVAHGGQIVMSGATAAIVRSAVPLVHLGSHRLRDLSDPEDVWQVGTDVFPPLRSLDAIPGNLPAQLSSFVGRSEELRDVGGAVRSHRLVTLTGVGGVGKTRLALQVAAEVAPMFPGGAWLIELAPVLDGADVAGAALLALSLRQHQGKPVEDSVIDSLVGTQALLVVDNCEHLVAPVARFVDRLLRSCPAMSVLATSREGLGVGGEHIIAVGSLARADGARLFHERAEQAGDRSATEERDGDALVGEICDRLDGIPLAIELAAARVRALGVSGVAGRLGDRFRLLRGGRASAERHQTLRATVEWSYRLLDHHEQAVLDALSVFAGDFTLTAAEAVAGDPEDVDVLDALVSLVDKSLLSADHQAPGHVRYRLLETIRQYAEERLDAAGLAEQARGRHAAFFAGFVAREVARAKGPGRMAAMATLEHDLGNIRGAVQWAVATDDLDLAARILVPFDMSLLWATRLGTAIAALAPVVLSHRGWGDHPARAQALAFGAYHAVATGDLTRAAELAALLVAAPTLPDTTAELFAADVLSLTMAARGDYASGAENGLARVALARRAGLVHALGHHLISTSAYLTTLDRTDEAAAAAEEAFAIGVELGDPYLTTCAAAELSIQLAISDPVRLIDVAEKGLAGARHIDYPFRAMEVVTALGIVRRRVTSEDLAVIEWVLGDLREGDDRMVTDIILSWFGIYVLHVGRVEDGVRIASSFHQMASAALYDRLIRQPASATLSPAAVDTLLEEGSSRSTRESLALARRVLKEQSDEDARARGSG